MTMTEIRNKADLLAQALTMLSEIADRYDLFADQMEVSNNPDAAEIFQWLSDKQATRAQQVKELSQGIHLPHIEPWNYNWEDAINIEISGNTSAHYLMTPHQALSLAMHVEESACDFFNKVVKDDAQQEPKELAIEFAKDAHRFKKQLEQRRAEYPEPEEGWDEDPDPPLLLE